MQVYDSLGAGEHLKKFEAAVEICSKSMEGSKSVREDIVALTGRGRRKEAKRRRRQGEFRNTQALINRYGRLLRETKQDID